MAHFAKISDDNVVIDVNVLNNQEVLISKKEEEVEELMEALDELENTKGIKIH